MTATAIDRTGAPSVRVPDLYGDDVHVWFVDLDAARLSIDTALATLSEEERARAERFRFERDRIQFAASRDALRLLIGAYLGVDPADLAFDTGVFGKPKLAGADRRRIAFNVSHSGSVALIAVSRRGEIGVDVEAHRPIEDRDDLADQFFSPSEALALQRLPPSARNEAFFACWTRKEAYVKAVGDGLSCPLDSFDVTFAPGETARLTVRDDPAASSRWTLTALPAPRGYAAALVTEGRRRVTCSAWSDVNRSETRTKERV